MRVGSDVGDQFGVGLGDFQEVFGGPKSSSFDGAGDVEHGVALGHDHAMEVNVAAAQALLDVNDAGRLVEEIFPRLERALAVHVVPEHKRFFAADEAGGFELGGDAVRGIARAQHHERLPGGLDRGQHSPGKPPGSSDDGDQQEPDNSTHDGYSLDDAGIGSDLPIV